MKNLTKIFMAFVAVMLASCVTDTTVDSAIELGKVKATIDLSLEGTKTHLGEKVDKQYPLLWSEGDQIAVNGFVSEPLAAEFDGKANASFEIESNTELTYPRSIVYPAPAEGAGVTFPATQVYKAGNIADGMAPLYGYAAEGEVPTLKHLTGVLKFAVKGNVTLSSMTVKAESGAIAGSYDINFETGELTAQKGKTSEQITMLFGDGLALNAEEATPLYITVPAGSYGAVRITLATTDAKKMTIKFDTSDAKAIAAGTVREFPAFIFVENDLDGDIFEIWDIEDLKMFAKTAESFPWKEAKLMATIDMTGEEWTPIEGFTKVFDGGNENATQEGDEGICIKGLSAPLFGTVAADIKNLKLVDVAIVETERVISGAIACQILGGSLDNCSTSGAFEMNNTTYAVDGEGHGVRSIGCMVGVVKDSPISNCVNNIDLTITDMQKNDVIRVTDFDFAGVVGAVDNTTVQDYSNLKNNGDIIYNREVKGKVRPALAGIAGYSTNANYTNIYNHGDLVCNTDIYCMYTGGLFGYAINTSATTGESHGDITLHEDVNYTYLGGIAGTLAGNTIEKNTLDNLDNYGHIEIKDTAQLLENCYVGGIAGSAGKTGWYYNDCDNSGNITIAAAQTAGTAVYAGILAVTKAELVVDCDNSGAITVTGDSDAAEACYIGGVIANATSNSAIEGNEERVKNCTNSGAITLSASKAKAPVVGGIVAYYNSATAGQKISGCVNKTGGDILVSCAASGVMSVGGVGGNIKANHIVGCKNYAAVTVSGSATSTLSIAGTIAYHHSSGSNPTISQCENHGTVTLSSTGNKGQTHLAGVVGYEKNAADTSCCISNLTNKGKVVFSGGIEYTKTYIAGVAANVLSNSDTLTNEGDVEILGSIEGLLYAGGVMSYTPSGVTAKNITNQSAADILIGETATLKGLIFGGAIGVTCGTENVYNHGTVTYKGTTNMTGMSKTIDGTAVTSGCTYFLVGGAIGFFSGTNTAPIINYSTGTVTVAGKFTPSYNHKDLAGYTAIGGAVGSFPKNSQENVHNYAEVNITSTEINASKWNEYPFTFAGCIGFMTGGAKNISNEGALNVSCYCPSDEPLRISGVIGRGSTNEASIYDNIVNKGNITISAQTTQDNILVAGINAYYAYSTYSNIRNEGNIVIEKESSVSASYYVGGIFISPAASASAAGSIVNTGNITVNGTAGEQYYVAGISPVIRNNKIVDGAQSYCDIAVINKPADKTFIGMITSTARSAEVVATNCKLGGRIATTESEQIIQGEDGQEVPVVAPDWQDIDGSNFFDYIYPSADWTGVTDYDGCSWLSEKPTVQ